MNRFIVISLLRKCTLKFRFFVVSWPISLKNAESVSLPSGKPSVVIHINSQEIPRLSSLPLATTVIPFVISIMDSLVMLNEGEWRIRNGRMNIKRPTCR